MPTPPSPELERLQLVGSAIAGRTIDVTAATPGERSWSDGNTVFLEVGDHRQRVVMLAVQASLIAAGSLEPEVLRVLRRRPTLARRYLAVEGHRALAANRDVLPPTVWTAIDRDLAERVTGPEASLDLSRGGDRIDGPPRTFGAIQPARVLGAAVASSSPAAGGPTPRPPSSIDARRELPDDDEDDDRRDARDVGNLLSSPVGGGGPIGRLLARLLAPVRERGGGGPPGADAPTHRGRPRPGPTPGPTSGRATSELTHPDDDVPGGGTRYPEWDVHRHRYRPEWCTVIECDAPSDAASPPAMVDTIGLRRPLAHLGVGLTRQRRQRQGDDIDIDALVETCTDSLAGRPADGDVYIESQRRRRDLSVLVLLDVSGSAAEPGTGGRAVHEHQRSAATALATALYELGDRVGLYAFNSRGRSAVQLARVKAFDEPLDGVSARRLGGLQPAAYTRLGAAIRHGTTIVEQRGGTPRRLLVVVSDGFAYDHGYEGRYGEADARRALVEARRRGVGCVCLSVGATTDPAALRRVFGSAAHAVVPRPDQLAALVAPLFQQAMRSAEAQRRVSQRVERHERRLDLERRIDVRRGQAVLRPGR